MTLKGQLQSAPASAEQGQGTPDAPDRDFDFRAPWLTSRQATRYIGCKSVTAFYTWKRRHHIVSRSNGTVAKADLDRELKKRRHISPRSLANLRRTSA